MNLYSAQWRRNSLLDCRMTLLKFPQVCPTSWWKEPKVLYVRSTVQGQLPQIELLITQLFPAKYMKNLEGCRSHIPLFQGQHRKSAKKISIEKKEQDSISCPHSTEFQLFPNYIYVFPTIPGRLRIFKIFSEWGKIRKWFHFSFIPKNIQDDWLIYSFSAFVGKGVEGSLKICTEYSKKNIKPQGKGIVGRTARQRRNRLECTEFAIKIWKITWKLAKIRLCLLVINTQTNFLIACKK